MFREWFAKLAWMLISFKVWSFSTMITILIMAWLSVQKGFMTTVSVAKDLHDSNYINSEQFTSIITHAQTVYMDSLMGHVSVLGSAVLVAIIALKAATDWQALSKDKEVIKKADGTEFHNGNLSKFLSKAGK
jgi:hypothetical protein